VSYIFVQRYLRTALCRSRTTADCTTAVLRTWRAYQLPMSRSPVSTSTLLQSYVTRQVCHKLASIVITRLYFYSPSCPVGWNGISFANCFDSQLLHRQVTTLSKLFTVHTHEPLSPSTVIWYRPKHWEGNGDNGSMREVRPHN